MTDQEIISGSLRNEKWAQEALFSRYSRSMLGLCYRYARHRHNAEDMLQEGFMKVFSQIHQFRGEGSLEGWIRKIMVHTCINNIKKNKKFNETIELVHAHSMVSREDWIPSIIQAKEIVECIRLLPIGYRTVLNLFAIEGYSHREIGGLLEIEESTSRSQYTRAKSMLEQILRERNILETRSDYKLSNRG
jgi:RNA polymerase sigma-70 factor (ECF subfamily)